MTSTKISGYRTGDDCIWDHCSTIATCPCCRKDSEIKLLEDRIEKEENRAKQILDTLYIAETLYPELRAKVNAERLAALEGDNE